MDHHCRKPNLTLYLIAWINNCIGLENYRYFLLAILYMWVGLGYNLITIFSIWNHHIYRQNSGMMNFITLLDLILMIIMCGINGWNWFLAFSGWSTVEMWSNKTKVIIRVVVMSV